jgi:uncharacterized damage-inducible protein DinB
VSQSPELASALAVFEEIYGAMAELVRPLDQAALNWAPLARDTNSIAVLVHHVVGSSNGWLARAVGEPFERDRDAEFRRSDGPAALVALIESARSEVRRRFGLLGDQDLSQTLRVTRVSAPDGEEVSRAWCVAHALAHLSEHWGAMQLTRQLYEGRR